jgi:hypothetical protein
MCFEVAATAGHIECNVALLHHIAQGNSTSDPNHVGWSTYPRMLHALEHKSN